MTPSRRFWALGLLLAIAYALLRIALLPANPEWTVGFSHDSAYLVNVAQNLRAGKGFVLDALLWVFLLPDSLPMPYHNANPLFPILIAALNTLGVDFFRAPFLLSAVSGAGLTVALTWLLTEFFESPWTALGVAWLTALFPPIFTPSLHASTDELWVMLMVAFAAALVRSQGWRMAVLAGILLGLAWLTRAVAILALPGAVVWLFLKMDWRGALQRLAMVGLTAGVVASPWLVHTAIVWGSPWRNDNESFMAINAYSLPAYDNNVERALHSPVAPDGFLATARRHPREVLTKALAGVWPVAREFMRAAAASSHLSFAFLGAAALLVGLRAGPRIPSIALAATGAYAVALLGTLFVLGREVEDRYFIFLYALLLPFFFGGLAWECRQLVQGHRSVTGIAAVALASVYVSALLPTTDLRLAKLGRSPGGVQARCFPVLRQMRQEISKEGPLVVGAKPYYYAAVFGAPALAIPQSDDAFLIRYMRRYHARYLLLSDTEQEYWKPQWTSEAALPVELHVAARIGRYRVYEIEEGASLPR
jgi:hypothetical protein